MKSVRYKNRQALQDSTGAIFFFGKGGFVDIQDSLIVAHITQDNKKLAVPDFNERSFGPQELVITTGGLAGMLTHLGVPVTSKSQKQLKSYLEHPCSLG